MAAKQPTTAIAYSIDRIVLRGLSIGGRPNLSDGAKRISQMATQTGNQNWGLRAPPGVKKKP